MGICIAYMGKLRDPALVPDLVRDLKAKAEAVGWPYKTMSELVAEDHVTCSGLEGITLYPHPQCEPLHFHFDREGTFINHMYYTLLTDTRKADMIQRAMAESMACTRRLTGDSGDKPVRPARADGDDSGLQVSIGVPGMPEAPGRSFFEEGSRYNWTKTQFAGAKVHVAVCAILDYVKQRYSPDLEIKDDSGYFVDKDYEKLETQLAYVGYLTEITSQAVEAAATSGARSMTLDEFVARINEELAGAQNKLH